jgi:hypothetical protein
MTRPAEKYPGGIGIHIGPGVMSEVVGTARHNPVRLLYSDALSTIAGRGWSISRPAAGWKFNARRSPRAG